MLADVGNLDGNTGKVLAQKTKDDGRALGPSGLTRVGDGARPSVPPSLCMLLPG